MISVKAELNHRRLLETRLAIESAERARLKILAEARRVAEENRVKDELEKAKKDKETGKSRFDRMIMNLNRYLSCDSYIGFVFM